MNQAHLVDLQWAVWTFDCIGEVPSGPMAIAFTFRQHLEGPTRQLA
jgi:hypothetical protein